MHIDKNEISLLASQCCSNTTSYKSNGSGSDANSNDTICIPTKVFNITSVWYAYHVLKNMSMYIPVFTFSNFIFNSLLKGKSLPPIRCNLQNQ